METERYCPGCRNRCPLSNPMCDRMKDPAIRERLEEMEKRAKETCSICEKRCSLDKLECSMGETIYRIKSRNNK